MSLVTIPTISCNVEYMEVAMTTCLEETLDFSDMLCLNPESAPWDIDANGNVICPRTCPGDDQELQQQVHETFERMTMALQMHFPNCDWHRFDKAQVHLEQGQLSVMLDIAKHASRKRKRDCDPDAIFA